jgi:hypothetical protein
MLKNPQILFVSKPEVIPRHRAGEYREVGLLEVYRVLNIRVTH